MSEPAKPMVPPWLHQKPEVPARVVGCEQWRTSPPSPADTSGATPGCSFSAGWFMLPAKCCSQDVPTLGSPPPPSWTCVELGCNPPRSRPARWMAWLTDLRQASSALWLLERILYSLIRSLLRWYSSL